MVEHLPTTAKKRKKERKKETISLWVRRQAD
jgi:hypothetical protein